jgi:hypothetical protein
MPGYIGDLRHVLASDYGWRAFRQLPDAIRLGGAVEDISPLVFNKLYAENYAAGYHHAGYELVAILSSWALRKKTLNVLDLYAGNGLLGFSLAQKLNNVHVWTMEKADNLAICRKFADEMNVAHRVQCILIIGVDKILTTPRH